MMDPMPRPPLDVLHDAWLELGDPRPIVAINEVSAMVSTNRVYRLVLADGDTRIAKLSSYGSYFLFYEDHDRIHRCNQLLVGTRYGSLLADSVLRPDGHVFTHYEGDAWVVFYDEVPRKRSLPPILDDNEIDRFATEMALFHRQCAEIAPQIPPASASITSDAVSLLRLVSDPSAAARFDLSAEGLDVVRRHTHEFLQGLQEVGYSEWQKMPVLIDWNLGNFSVEDSPEGFRLFSRWDYDWFRIDTRLLDFYFLSRVSSRTGDRSHFTYSPHTLLEPRFRRFLRAYHGVYPLTEADILFLKEAYRFFILQYVISQGDAFFRADIWERLQREAVAVYLPAVERLDLTPLLDLL